MQKKLKMPKCPYCPGVKFDTGKITIGKDYSLEVVYCARCKSIIHARDNTLKKLPPPENEKGRGGITRVEMLGL